jgi:hypothetical protein
LFVGAGDLRGVGAGREGGDEGDPAAHRELRGAMLPRGLARGPKLLARLPHRGEPPVGRGRHDRRVDPGLVTAGFLRRPRHLVEPPAPGEDRGAVERGPGALHAARDHAMLGSDRVRRGGRNPRNVTR